MRSLRVEYLLEHQNIDRRHVAILIDVMMVDWILPLGKGIRRQENTRLEPFEL